VSEAAVLLTCNITPKPVKFCVLTIAGVSVVELKPHILPPTEPSYTAGVSVVGQNEEDALLFPAAAPAIRSWTA
jgi:hypothetical protein